MTDDDKNRHDFKNQLGIILGFSEILLADAAANGEEALRLLERHEGPVHLMVTDVVMPGMSGRTLAERFDGTRLGMKVLYMSGYTDDVVVRHGVLDEGMPFLGKPFTAVELTRKVREVLDSES